MKLPSRACFHGERQGMEAEGHRHPVYKPQTMFFAVYQGWLLAGTESGDQLQRGESRTLLGQLGPMPKARLWASARGFRAPSPLNGST